MIKSHSYSIISTAYKCHRMYKLKHIDGLKPDEKPSAALYFGTAMHAGLHAILEGDGNGAEEFSMAWNAIQAETGVEYYRDSFEYLQKAGETFLEKFRKYYAKDFVPTHPMETRLFGQLGDYKVEGTPDFIGTYKGVPSIVDWKTSKEPYTKDRIVCNEQMHLYAELANQVYGFKPKQIVYVVFCKDKMSIQRPLIQPLDKKRHKAMLDNIQAMCKDLETRTEFPMNRNSCLYNGKYRCGFWKQCYGGNENE